MRLFFPILLSFCNFSLIFPQYHSSEWASITSLLSPTGIQVTDEGIVYASTAGGLLVFNSNTEEFNFIKIEEGLLYLDLATIAIDNQGRLWLGGGHPKGCLQVYDPDIGLVMYIDWENSSGDDLVVSINMIQIGEDIAFAVFQGTTISDIGILEFELDDDGLPIYKDYYTEFNADGIAEIRDLDLSYDGIYVTTDQGIFYGNYSDNLKFSDNWSKIYSGDAAKQFLPGDIPLVLGDSSILYQQDDNWEYYCIGFTGNIIHAAKKDDKIGILTQDYFHEIIGCEIESLLIPVGDHQNNAWNAWGYDRRTFFTSFDYSGNGNVFIGIKDNGILYLDQDQEYQVYTPNTPIINSFQAITITKDGHLVGTSPWGTLFYNGIDHQNYIPNIYYKYYADESEVFHAVSLDYDPGDFIPISIVEKDNGNLIYCNSGVYSSSSMGGAVIELNYTSGEPSIIKYDSLNQIIDGMYGIFNPEWFTHYMVVNQIEKDKLGNIWISNPFCERYGHLLAIQLADDDSWSHVHIPDENSYRPQTIALDERDSYKRAWIGFAKDGSYSSGGIKVLKYFDIVFDENTDSTWLTITNPEILPGGNWKSIWSLVIDHMGFLWVLSDIGVQGYQISGNNEITLEPLRMYLDEQGESVSYDFLTYLSYEKGNRIKVDSQNNKWVITHQGVWVIQENLAFWPSEDGLHPENSGLLSDIVYDVAFDNEKDLAYLSTNKGISIIVIPPANNSTWLGCTDPEACNYSPDANVDDSSCLVEDCAGECGGDAVVDCAGVCDGDAECEVAGNYIMTTLIEYNTSDCSGQGQDIIEEGMSMTLSLNYDGSAIFYSIWNGTTFEQYGSWIQNGNQVTITTENDSITFELSGNTLTAQNSNIDYYNGYYYEFCSDIVFTKVTDCSYALGDINGDESWNIQDIVILINCVLLDNCDEALGNNICAGDINGDESWNIQDIVILINCVLLDDCDEVLDTSDVIDSCDDCGVCDSDATNDGVELWGVCYNIENTTALGLGGTGLTGEIPLEIGNLTNLTNLNLGANQLTGEIPESVGQLTNLTSLSLAANQLTGEIPESVGQLTNLTELWLGSNQLTGEIPEEIWTLTNLIWLDLYSNQLIGEIPPEIGQLTNLTWLGLQINQLTGEIPPEIGLLTNLTDLYLDNNQLSGEIPAEICNQGDNTPSVGYNKLCPPYPSCISQSDMSTQNTSECPD